MQQGSTPKLCLEEEAELDEEAKAYMLGSSVGSLPQDALLGCSAMVLEMLMSPENLVGTFWLVAQRPTRSAPLACSLLVDANTWFQNWAELQFHPRFAALSCWIHQGVCLVCCNWKPQIVWLKRQKIFFPEAGQPKITVLEGLGLWGSLFCLTSRWPIFAISSYGLSLVLAFWVYKTLILLHQGLILTISFNLSYLE